MADEAFRENVVVITGASSGIGRAMALQLAGEGAWLVLAARDAQRLESVAAECRSRGGRALVAPTDVSQESQCRSLIEQTVSAYGRIDTLVNNAGISMWTPFTEMQDLRPFEDIMRVNYFGSVYCTFYALPHLKQTRGRIVAVASLAGKSGIPTRSAYAASKHAMIGFFDTLRIELAGTGVSVTVACPDFVASEIRERAYGADGKPLGKSPVQETKVMTAETCASQIIAGAAARRRELIMSTRGKILLPFKFLLPSLVDRMAARAIRQGK